MDKVVPIPAPKPRSNTYRNLAWFYAALLVLMAVGQLFAFEDLVPLMRDYGLAGGQGTATLLAGTVVVAEVLALPFLLRMPLSPLMRWFSMACSIAAPVAWLLLSIYSFTNRISLQNAGILGTHVDVSSSVQHIISAFLVLLALVVAYGLSPKR